MPIERSSASRPPRPRWASACTPFVSTPPATPSRSRHTASSTAMLENRFLRVAIDSMTGGIASIVEKSGGAELLRRWLTARFLCTEPVVDSSAAEAQVTLERSDSVGQGWLISGQWANCPYRFRLSLAHESPILEIDLEIDYGRGSIFGFKAAAWHALAARVPLQGLHEALGQPAVRRLRDGGRKPDRAGLPRPGLRWPRGGVGERRRAGAAHAGEDVAVLISDGVPPLRGVHRYRYGIYPHSGDWGEARVPWRAWEFQQPLGAKPLEDRCVSLPFSRSYLQTTENVVLSGLHFHEDKPRNSLL